MGKRMGEQTIIFQNCPKIIGNYSIVGEKEGKSNFGKYFDYIIDMNEVTAGGRRDV